jgi:hypothetical protein
MHGSSFEGDCERALLDLLETNRDLLGWPRS